LIIDIAETKSWLRVDHSSEDILINTLIAAAEKYLTNATDNRLNGKNELAKLLCFVLVTDWYENREMVGRVSEKVRGSVESILTQLAYSAPAVPSELTGVAGNGFADLSWEANTENDLTGYYVFQDGTLITSTPITDNTYKVTGLTNGVSYSFRVSAVDSNWNESGLSTAVSVTPTI
jgi:uncharacterized phage protein (predicted DNA packaging)